MFLIYFWVLASINDKMRNMFILGTWGSPVMWIMDRWMHGGFQGRRIRREPHPLRRGALSSIGKRPPGLPPQNAKRLFCGFPNRPGQPHLAMGMAWPSLPDSDHVYGHDQTTSPSFQPSSFFKKIVFGQTKRQNQGGQGRWRRSKGPSKTPRWNLIHHAGGPLTLTSPATWLLICESCIYLFIFIKI